MTDNNSEPSTTPRAGSITHDVTDIQNGAFNEKIVGWRRENPGQRYDLKDARLDGILVGGTDFRDVDLSKAVLKGAHGLDKARANTGTILPAGYTLTPSKIKGEFRIGPSLAVDCPEDYTGKPANTQKDRVRF